MNVHLSDGDGERKKARKKERNLFKNVLSQSSSPPDLSRSEPAEAQLQKSQSNQARMNSLDGRRVL